MHFAILSFLLYILDTILWEARITRIVTAKGVGITWGFYTTGRLFTFCGNTSCLDGRQFVRTLAVEKVLGIVVCPRFYGSLEVCG